MPSGTLITAAEYNNLRTLTDQVVGQGTSLGYGRSLLASANVVASSDKITSLQQTNLYKDVQAAHIHQNNFANTDVNVADIEVGDIINFTNVTNFTSMVGDITSFNPAVSEFPSANFDEAGLLTTSSTTTSSTRTSAWGTGSDSRIGHRVTLTWASGDARNFYFNAGGQVRFDASLTGGTSGTSNTKDWDWNRILSAMGKIRFYKMGTAYKTVSIASSGTGSEYTIGAISTNTATSGGFFNSATRLFTKVGGGVSGGASGTVPVTQIYDDNESQINVVAPNTSQLTFEIIFDDADTGTGGQSESNPDKVDEQVGGTVTSNLYSYRPNSSFLIGATTFPAIQQAAPTGAVDSSL